MKKFIAPVMFALGFISLLSIGPVLFTVPANDMRDMITGGAIFAFAALCMGSIVVNLILSED